jgi:hypothetical protein
MAQILRKAIPSFTILTIMLSFVQIAYSSGLVLTVTASKYYNLGENMIINGSLTLNGSPVSDGLVSIQINNPRGDSPENVSVMRVLTTGSEPSGPWPVEILEAYACDNNGNPVSSFRRGGAAGFNVTVKNNCANAQYAIVTLSLYDSSGLPFAAVLMMDETIVPYGQGSCRRWIEGIIPSDASLGTAHLYAAALTNWPQYGGIAWCPEKSGVFSITSSGGGGMSVSAEADRETYSSLSVTPGTFNMSFKISDHGGILGNYTVHATSWYEPYYITDQETFEAVLMADVNKDGNVNMLDLTLVIRAFMSKPGDPNWNKQADCNKDNVVNMLDIFIAINEFLEWGQY